MLILKQAKQDFVRPKPEPLAERKKRQSIEAVQAMADYIKSTEAARRQLAQLRAERLAREAGK